jgi:hypothetical protein
MGDQRGDKEAHVPGGDAGTLRSIEGSEGEGGESGAEKTEALRYSMLKGVWAIDPGYTQSAWVLWCDDRPVRFGITDNATLVGLIRKNRAMAGPGIDMAVEMIASYGMPVGREVFHTCVWIGRFLEAWGAARADLVYRQEVKMHLCNSMKAKDGNIRQALIDRYGEPGTKKAPGRLYGVSKDVWSAIAVAVFYSDRKMRRPGSGATI